VKFQAARNLTLTAACLVAAGPLHAAPGLTAIVVTGDPVPDGVGGFGSFSSFTETDINNAGQVAFTNLAGVFRWDGAELTRVALRGDTVPEASEVFGRFIRPDIDDTGRVGFLTNSGAGLGDGLALSSIVMTGETAPGGNGTFGGLLPVPFAQHTTFALNNAGQSAFTAFVGNTTDNTNGRGLFLRDGASITRVVQEKHPLAGIGGTVIGLDSPYIPAFNNSGQVGFAAGIAPPIGDNYSGVFIGDGNSNTLIARWSDPVPGGSGILSGFFAPAINNHGQAGFIAVIYDDNAFTRGMFIGDGNSLSLVARVGQPAPDGVGVFRGFADVTANMPVINDVGQIAFWAFMEEDLGGGTSAYTEGIYFGDGDSLIQIARTGQTTPDGTATYGDFREAPDLNEAGQLVFQADLSDGMRGIYLYDPIMGVIEMVRTGDTLLGREILEINACSVGCDPHFTAINDSGQVPFQFVLADGREGIAVVIIPEPGTAVILGLFGSGLLARRRQAGG
jgi:hypothetical protein